MVKRRSNTERMRKALPNFSRETAARDLGIVGEPYNEGTAIFELTERENWATGASRKDWEIPEYAIRTHTQKYVEGARSEMEELIWQRVEPLLESMEENLESGKKAATAAKSFLTVPDTIGGGDAWDAKDAVDKLKKLEVWIGDDEQAGLSIHQPASRWFFPVGVLFLILDAVGLWAVFAGFLNANFMRPWENVLQLTLALFMTAVLVVGQVMFARSAGESHNNYRFIEKSLTASNFFETSKARKSKNGKNEVSDSNLVRQKKSRKYYIIGLAIVTLICVLAILIRAFDALNLLEIETWVKWVLYGVAAASPVLMSVLMYLSKAVDGSMYTREKESLAEGIENSVQHYQRQKDIARNTLSVVEADSDSLWSGIFNDVISKIQEVLDSAIEGFRFAEVQIGCKSTDIPPPQESKYVTKPAKKSALSMPPFYLQSRIPKSAELEIKPIHDKIRALVDLDSRYEELKKSVDAIKQHPGLEREPEEDG